MKIGYFLSCEEFTPRELLEQAALAQKAGIDRLWISDHYHPWNDEQGQSAFVWSMIGALAQAVPGMHVTTGVTCPTMRIHPAVIARAAATSAVLLEGRFSLGVGTGEALNEHIFGDAWPSADAPASTSSTCRRSARANRSSSRCSSASSCHACEHGPTPHRRAGATAARLL